MAGNQPAARSSTGTGLIAVGVLSLGALVLSAALSYAHAAPDTTPSATKSTTNGAISTISAAPGELDRSVLQGIGRAATAAEIKAWDIDVRADFKDLPEGSGSVSQGEEIWEAQCTSCHGVFGESNEVFTPLVGGTSKEDIEAGRVQNLTHDGYPHRTTLMKASKLSTLWDYINRAMPWNEPKSLATDEVYAVLAYLLNLGGIVPADFTLSQRNMAEVQQRLPNRDGMLFYPPMWITSGSGDVSNAACMTDCPVEAKLVEALPDTARNTHGNIADQVRPFGPARGTNTAPPGETAEPGTAAGSVAAAASSASPAAVPATSGAAAAGSAAAGSAASGAAAGQSLVKANACTACHGIDNKIIGPGFREIAARHAGKSDVVSYLNDKIVNGGQGVWGPIPMPAQPQVKEVDAGVIAAWIAEGAK